MTARRGTCRNQGQVLLHHFPIDQRTEQRLRCPGGRTNRTKEISVLELLLLNGTRATTSASPKAGGGILLSKPGFVLKPDIDIRKRNMARDVKDRFQSELF